MFSECLEYDDCGYLVAKERHQMADSINGHIALNMDVMRCLVRDLRSLSYNTLSLSLSLSLSRYNINYSAILQFNHVRNKYVVERKTIYSAKIK